MDDFDENVNEDEDRLGPTFHRSFYLKRSAVRQIIEFIGTQYKGGKKDKVISWQDIRDNTQLGTVQVSAFPRWAIGSGILLNNKQLTKFGNKVFQLDIGMDHLGTQWLMHYHLSAPHGPGPRFWHELVCNRFRTGDEFTQEDIQADIARIYLGKKGKELSPGSAISTANAFLETYIKTDGLGNLGILEETAPNQYLVRETDMPPVWVMAAALLDYWQAVYPTQVTVSINSLTRQSNLANLFMVSGSRLDLVLEEMREVDIVDLFRTAPPYQAVLRNGDEGSILERIYSHDPYE